MSNVSLGQFLKQSTHLTENLSQLIETIANTCKTIDLALQKGALAGVLGSAEHENVQGETQKKLDVISNDLLVDALTQHSSVAAIASEELDDMTPAQQNGEFLVLFDPLDGSSNIDINMCVGTIFSILKASENTATTADFFQKGADQVAAGYVMYGPSTMLVFTTGQGVHMFTLDPEQHEFYLTVDGVKIPEQTQEFAINSSNQRHWEAPVKRYINELLEGTTGVRGKDFNMRWVACMVGDVHRILTRGGIFMYPYDSKDPQKAGRLRLMYEANPLGLIVEQAGGKISTGRQDILTIVPEGLHQRIPVILGAKAEVDRLVDYHQA
ncbi:class 1 fructose-bisphosphatase [Acinetobacter qingfengensis]|uniref:Fructose-1,6-bisphosphatase class 1 n=1 Tax=Acinetobacter qingfengensis TaxID=1262585 RepID=A0A1E7RFX7_9GAMM|nr:class 1 fructose-bisphosphatase [Acinetobacter qingfengensis]KAA8732724.1 class 1 fructose-bisphosphatase [Acinetobacter qingfengensis]OEY98162.1 fructose-bisphosphatase [Acinetobacter qingfengensis]